MDGRIYATKTLARMTRRLEQRDAERAANDLRAVGCLMLVAGRKRDASSVWTLATKGPLALSERHRDRAVIARLVAGESSDDLVSHIAADCYTQFPPPGAASEEDVVD